MFDTPDYPTEKSVTVAYPRGYVPVVTVILGTSALCAAAPLLGATGLLLTVATTATWVIGFSYFSILAFALLLEFLLTPNKDERREVQYEKGASIWLQMLLFASPILAAWSGLLGPFWLMVAGIILSHLCYAVFKARRTEVMA